MRGVGDAHAAQASAHGRVLPRVAAGTPGQLGVPGIQTAGVVMEWFRWYHGSVNDPKFRVIAKKAGATVAEALAFWASVLEQASAAPDRGNPGKLDYESLECALELEEGCAARLHDQLKARGLIEADTGRIAAWDRRQPKRERDDNSAQRVKEHRERQKGVSNATVTPCNAIETQETPRGDKRREEKEEKTLSGKPDDAVTVLEHLNAKAGKRYRPVEANLRLIRARLRESACSDVLAVIDTKASEWAGTEYEKYLRPETLFRAGKFESYVGQLGRSHVPSPAPWFVKAGFGSAAAARAAGHEEDVA